MTSVTMVNADGSLSVLFAPQRHTEESDAWVGILGDWSTA